MRRRIAANDSRVSRFRADLEALTGRAPAPGHRLALALSGGPDSTALLLLAAAGFPGSIAAATVDHSLRPESAAEAAGIAAVCCDLGVPHATLTVDWDRPPRANLQARARERRYQALAGWAAGENCEWVAVAHHLDDQAETLLMRLARGSGLRGAAAMRTIRPLGARGEGRTLQLVRPLLGWRRDELAGLVAEAGIAAVDDPANRDLRHDRSRVRQTLASTPWLAPERLAAAAAHFGEAEAALDWIVDGLWADRAELGEDGLRLDAGGLPRELQRRLLARAIAVVGSAEEPPGPKLARLLDTLVSGRVATITGVKCAPGPPWRFSLAPGRRTG